MTIHTPPTDETSSRDRHLGRDRDEIHIGRIFDLPQASDPGKAGIPSLKPSLYIYDIPALISDIQERRSAKAKALQDIVNPQSQTLTRAMLESTLGRYDRLLGKLGALASQGETGLVRTTPIEDLRPASYAYEVKMLRHVFEMAHNYAHQKVLADRANNVFYVGASEAVLKEVALDHVTAQNSRQSGHQYLQTPVLIESTLVRTGTVNSYNPYSLPTLTKLRETGLARPAVFRL